MADLFELTPYLRNALWVIFVRVVSFCSRAVSIDTLREVRAAVSIPG
jgi:hypothetical protein